MSKAPKHVIEEAKHRGITVLVPGNEWATVTKPKTMKKTTKGGITFRKGKGGINVTIASYNGNKLAPMMGYNTKASMQKGLKALKTILDSAYDPATGKFNVTDLTPKKK